MTVGFRHRSKTKKEIKIMFTKQRKSPSHSRNWLKASLTLLMLVMLCLATPKRAAADEVTDWNQITQQAIKTANTPNPISGRILALVHASIFDAVNGIERRYTPYHIDFDAPRGASRRAAAIQAAYAPLVKLFPKQKATFDARREASLAAITDDGDFEDSESIARGIEWGQTVADDILAWRSTDGFNTPLPPFRGNTAAGQWRPTPPAFAPAVFQQLAITTPFAMTSQSQFRPDGPPTLASDQYTADFNEVKAVGRATGSTRTPEQTEIARFWADSAPVHWNRIALAISAEHHLTLSENARLFALLNIAMADAAIAAWDAKFAYNFWRPITAIRLAATDGNDATIADSVWSPLLTPTPAHQDYVSNHSTVSGAAAAVLAAYFGDNNTFTSASDNLPGVLRTQTSFSGAANEANDSRVFAGIHFRSACTDGRATGDQIGNYVMTNLAQPLRGKRLGQLSHNHGTGDIGADGEIAGDDID
ncbi:MAG: vanadium-dependent haloperoxidase [bacterium]